MLYSGLDLHKRSVVITTLDEAGRTVQRGKLACDPLALRSYFARLPGPHAAAVEATGSWYWVSDLLGREGIDLRLAHAKYLKAIAYAKVKTDAVDSSTLAHLLRTGLLPEAHMIRPELRAARDLLRTRLLLVEKRTSARNSMARLLEKYNVASPEALPAPARLQASLFADQIQLLGRQIRRLEREVQKDLLTHPDVQRLLWVPGIGKLAALTIHLEVDTITRFPTERHFFSYCRLVPGSANSAGRTRHKPSKDGNRYLKLVFSTAAIRAIQYFPEIRSWAARKARTKNKHVARALVAKELARICYHMLRNSTEFNGRFKGVELGRTKKLEWPRRASPGG